MSRSFVFCLLILFCSGQEAAREPKFFFGQKPHTVINYRQVSQFVTEFTPSSCIVIEPSLPPCRYVRSLELHPSTPTRITKTQSPQINNFQIDAEQRSRPLVPSESSEAFSRTPTPPMRIRPQRLKTHSHYWAWNLFNPFRIQNVTHTETKTQYITTRIEDPHTVVSFYIKGCRPSVLPFNLAECYIPGVAREESKNIVVMAPLKFIPSIEKDVISTFKKFEKNSSEKKNDEEEIKSLGLTSTEDSLSQTTETELSTQNQEDQDDAEENNNFSQTNEKIDS